MGIALQQLTPGQYYKGYHQPAPNGMKCVFYITRLSYSGKVQISVSYEVILRHTPCAIWTAGVFTGSVADESLAKQGVSTGYLPTEGLPWAPSHGSQFAPSQKPNQANPQPIALHPTAPVPALHPTSVKPIDPLKQWLDANGKKISEAEAKAQAKAERNKGKSVVYGNAHSERCLRCGAPNKPIMSIGMYWCDHCEPE